jgi:hypothetical protein
MLRAQDQFSQFYVKKFQNRKILWLLNHGNLQMQTNYLPKNYQVVVNVFQAAILCLFNEHEALSFQELKDRCQLSEGDLI